VLQTLGSRAVSAIVFIILARVLGPTSFGLVALASVFVALMQVFVDQGFGQAIVQRPNLEPGHLDSAFWACLVIGIVLTTIGVGSAGILAELLDEPKLGPVLRVLSVSLLLASLSSTPGAILQREMAFRSLAIRQLVATLAGAVVGVGAALAGFGVWSLVAQLLGQSLVATVILWVAVPWRPGLAVSREHLRELFGFGSKVMGMNVMTFLNRRSDDLLIGAVLGAKALGIYSVAYRLLVLATDVLTMTIQRVALPVFARVQGDPLRLRSAVLQAVRQSLAAAAPTFLLMSALAAPIVHVFFGGTWDDAIPVLRVLALIGVVQAGMMIGATALIATGNPRKSLTLSMIDAASNVPAFVVAVHWGVLAVAAAYVIRGYLVVPISVRFLQGVVPVPTPDYVRAAGLPVGCAGVAAGIVAVLAAAMPGSVPDIVTLSGLGGLGIGIYLTLLNLLDRAFIIETRRNIVSALPALRRLPGLRASR
jgi:O-antigen/teichoic acid export membrane protein